MTENKTYYEVRYVYYQYNSGPADNGTYRESRKFDSFDEAKKMQAEINYCYENRQKMAIRPNMTDAEWEESDRFVERYHECYDKYCSYDGYFTAPATLWKIEKKEEKVS